jgi:hypothetical protein
LRAGQVHRARAQAQADREVVAVNAAVHESFAKASARLVLAHGFAPKAVPMLLADREQFWKAAAQPDDVQEVGIHVPGDGKQTDLLGQNPSSLGHFQRENDEGYLLSSDPSLYVGGIAAELASLAHLRVLTNDGGTRPPLTGLLEDRPIVAACATQPGETIGKFLFPSCAAGADYFARGARRWIEDIALTAEVRVAGARCCLGYALHFVHDSHVPHHAWGSLLGGHQEWEDAQEREWLRTLAKVQTDNQLFEETVAKAVRRELAHMRTTTVGDLCREGAAWARGKFGDPRRLEECPGNVALDVSIVAIAASVRALEIVTAA